VALVDGTMHYHLQNGWGGFQSREGHTMTATTPVLPWIIRLLLLLVIVMSLSY
jgi:hypothetical protein